MWPRYCEMLIGAWLLASPFIFPNDDSSVAWNDFASGAAIIACAAVSFWRPMALAHLAQLAIALWLLGFAFLYTTEPLPALQNDIISALVLMMFGIIPNHATMPPVAWRKSM